MARLLRCGASRDLLTKTQLIGKLASMTSNADAAAAAVPKPIEDAPTAAELPDEQYANPSVRYSVCKEKAGGRKFVFRKGTDEQHSAEECRTEQEQERFEQRQALQEAIQAQAQAQPAGSARPYRNFAASTTYKNVTLPLKSSKLANPFPEPVKIMPSHTVSDQEKAEQMLAEFRVPRSVTKKGGGKH